MTGGMQQGGMSAESTAERLAKLEAAVEQTSRHVRDLSEALANVAEAQSKASDPKARGELTDLAVAKLVLDVRGRLFPRDT